MFFIYLPGAADDHAEKEQQHTAGEIPAGTERVLFVDDEELLRDIGSKLLASLGYRVKVCKSPEEALDEFTKDPQGFDLVVTDQTMPGMTGYRLSEKLMKVRKDIPVILCTGYSETVSEQKARAAGIREYILKPLDRKNLARTVRKVLDEANK